MSDESTTDVEAVDAGVAPAPADDPTFNTNAAQNYVDPEEAEAEDE